VARTGGDNTTNITGNVSGMVATGTDITQTQQTYVSNGLTDPEWAQLEQVFEDLKERVLAEVPADRKAPALERVEEFQEALTAPEPDLSTVQYVKRWFVKRLPGLAGLLTGVLVHPLLGKLIQSAGDTAVAELARVAEE
jgi:hypothetical protein